MMPTSSSSRLDRIKQFARQIDGLHGSAGGTERPGRIAAMSSLLEEELTVRGVEQSVLDDLVDECAGHDAAEAANCCSDDEEEQEEAIDAAFQRGSAINNGGFAEQIPSIVDAYGGCEALGLILEAADIWATVNPDRPRLEADYALLSCEQVSPILEHAEEILSHTEDGDAETWLLTFAGQYVRVCGPAQDRCYVVPPQEALQQLEPLISEDRKEYFFGRLSLTGDEAAP
jgi:hypothetical protein